ncbi:MAG: ribonuclease P protein component [Armatimonadota bacterium]|nr:ribonuclease P protein component [bacterium]MDW8320712.1 ribonuclease P protein component [Armatimonadota bacterium]
MLPRHERLRRRKDFLACYNEGRAYAQAHLVLYVRPQSGGRRFGFVVGKKVGKAVVRNRVKRRLRAACRECLPNLSEGFDAVIVARRNAGEADYHQLLQEMQTLFRSAKVWKASAEP